MYLLHTSESVGWFGEFSGEAGCRSAAGGSCVAAGVKVHLAPVAIGLQSSKWFLLLLRGGGINHL